MTDKEALKQVPAMASIRSEMCNLYRKIRADEGPLIARLVRQRVDEAYALLKARAEEAYHDR